MVVISDRVVDDWSELASLIDVEDDSTWMTLGYLWHVCRCGIYVRVAESQLLDFVPFVNLKFKNWWNLHNLLPRDRDKWPEEALKGSPLDEWWCNAGLLCTGGRFRGWGTSFLAGYVTLLRAVAERVPEETIVFLNKRDFPNVRRDGKDPYGATFFGRRAKVVKNLERLRPILSGYTGDLFSDIPFPLIQDYEGPAPIDETKEEFELRWRERRRCAVFRGSVTGCGVTNADNPRLALVNIICRDDDDLFDVQLTGRNDRLRKHPNDNKLRVPPRIRRGNFLSIEEQAKCQMAIYVEGHSAASRMGRLLREGFCVLAIRTWIAPADKLFFFDLLIDREHLIWCTLEELPALVRHYATDGNDEARAIAWNARQFHAKYLTKEAIENYAVQTLVKTCRKHCT